jgi:hypothetical protein
MKKFTASIFIFFLSITLLVMPYKGWGKTDFTPSSSEDIALAFYKTAQAAPNFEEWAKQSDGFKNKSVTEAPNYIQKEKQRLLQKWSLIEKNGDILNIKTYAPFSITKIPPEKKGDEETYTLNILIDNIEETYFSYKHLQNNFAVIVPNIANHLTQKITKEQAALLITEGAGDNSQKAILDFQIKPLKSYTDKPLVIEKIEQWAMVGDIISLSMTSKQTGAPLFYYGTKGYISPKGQELRSIYKEK